MTGNVRENFEVWALTHFINSETMNPLERDDCNQEEYRFSRVNMAWIAWQASCESLVIELPPAPPVPEEPEDAIDDSHMDGYHAAVRMRSACEKSIKAAGLKVNS